MYRKHLIPSVSCNFSYSNEAFGGEDEERLIPELGGMAGKIDSQDSKLKPTLATNRKHGEIPRPLSFSNRVHNIKQTAKQHILEPFRKSIESPQRFRRSDVARHVARINESSEIRECLSFVCVLILGAIALGVVLSLMKFQTTSTLAAALAVVGSSVVLVFIFICITTFLKDGTSLHRR